jgi:hypothetical protein
MLHARDGDAQRPCAAGIMPTILRFREEVMPAAPLEIGMQLQENSWLLKKRQATTDRTL